MERATIAPISPTPTPTPRQIINDVSLTRDARFLLVLLSDMSRENGECSPGTERLCELMDAHYNSVFRWLSELEAKGLIYRKRNGQKPVRIILRTLIWCYSDVDSKSDSQYPQERTADSPKTVVTADGNNPPPTPPTNTPHNIYTSNGYERARAYTRESPPLENLDEWERAAFAGMTKHRVSPSTAVVILRDVRAGRFPDVQESMPFAERDLVAESRAHVDRQLAWFPFRDVKFDSGAFLAKAIITPGGYGEPLRYRTAMQRAETAMNAPEAKKAPDTPPCCKIRVCATHAAEKLRQRAADTNRLLRYAETEIEPDVLAQLRERAGKDARGVDRVAEMLLCGQIRKYAEMRGVTLP